MIAFLGLGNMGSGMAGRLLAAGHSLTVWNRSPEKATDLVGHGAILAPIAEEAVRESDVVISSLMDDASVRAVFDEKVLTALRPEAIHVCVTTISPGCADWLAEVHTGHGSRYVSGPVVGRPDAAKAGTLTQFLAGDASAFDTLEPICRAFAGRIVRIPGPARTANQQKLCINFFIISLIEAMAENYTLADKMGVSREIMAGFFDSAFALPGLKHYAKRLYERDADGTGGFGMKGGAKDVGLMLDAAHEAGCPIEFAEVIAGKMREALAEGMADVDWSAIQEVSRKRAGLDHRGSIAGSK